MSKPFNTMRYMLYIACIFLFTIPLIAQNNACEQLSNDSLRVSQKLTQINNALRTGEQTEHDLDSLIALYQHCQSKLAADMLIAKAALLADQSKYDEALKLLTVAMTKPANSETQANIFSTVGLVYDYQQDLTRAMDNYKKSYEVRKQTGDVNKVAASLISIGNVYLMQAVYDSALQVFLEAKKLYSSTANNRGLADASLNIGLVFDYQGILDKSIPYYHAALNYYSQLQDLLGVANCHNNLAIVFKNMNMLDSAIFHNTLSIQLYDKFGSKYGSAAAYTNRGNIFQLKSEFDKATDDFNQAYNIYQSIGSQHGLAAVTHSLGESSRMKHHYAKALKYYYQSLNIANKLGMPVELLDAQKGLQNTYEAIKQFDSAYFYFKMSQALEDSIKSLEKSRIIADLESKYESAKKDQEILALLADAREKENSMLKYELDIRKSRMQVVLALIILSFTLITAFVMISYREKKKRLEIANKEKEYQVALIQTQHDQRLNISRDMHDDLGSDLTRMSLICHNLMVKYGGSISDKELTDTFQTIDGLSRKVMTGMREVLWTMNPDYDNLPRFIAYIRGFVSDMVADLQIAYELTGPEQIDQIYLSPQVRKELLLIIKEAVNNAIKHSGCTHIKIKYDTENYIDLSIDDNGIGFDFSQQSNGIGMSSIHHRTAKIGGKISIKTAPGQGTVVHLSEIPYALNTIIM